MGAKAKGGKGGARRVGSWPYVRPTRALIKIELAAAARACLENARELSADARALLDMGRSVRAVALACVAVEELAKAQVCQILYHGEPGRYRYEDPAKFWEFWSRHDWKSAFALTGRDTRPPSPAEQAATVRVRLGVDPREALRMLGERHATAIEVAQMMCAFRERALYVDVGVMKDEPDSPVWVWRPGEMQDRAFADALLGMLDLRFAKLAPKVDALPPSPRPGVP